MDALRAMADVLRNPVLSIIAIGKYLEANPETPHRLDLLLTEYAAWIMYTCAQVEHSSFKPVFSDHWSIAQAVAQGLPDVLATGVVTTARIVPENDKDREDLIENVRHLADGCAKPVGELFEEARREAESLLVGGEERVKLEGVAHEQMARDVKTAEQAADAGDVDTAVEIFSKLKALEPSHTYYRSQLGWLHYRQERHWDALREWLYGFSLAPMDEWLAHRTMACLTGFGLFPPAVEVARHYRKIVPDTDCEELLAYESLARVCFSALLGVSAEAGPDNLSKEAPDLLDEYAPARPWLQEFIRLDAPRVFISYRRERAGDAAARLEQSLESKWEGAHVFRDASDLRGGEDWLRRLRDEIEQADVVVVLIDKGWARDERLADRNDVLRREVAWSLLKPADVLPVLLDGVRMPGAKKLPDELRGIADLQAMVLRKESFDDDAHAISDRLTSILTARKLRDQEGNAAIEELEELFERDPEAAAKKQSELFGPAIGGLPKFVAEKATGGHGVPIGKVEQHGTWIIHIRLEQGRMELRLTIEHHGKPFRGRWLTWDVFDQLVQDAAIERTWLPIFDVDAGVMLGFHLDGVRDGSEPFTTRIPFDRLAGESIVATDPHGSQYVCRNVEPRPGGF